MKKFIATIALALVTIVSVNAQDSVVKTVSLEQTKGEFTQKGLTLDAGSYVFEIANNHVGSDVGFVLVPAGKDTSKPENHIKTAYVTSVVKEGTKQKSNVTTLVKGEYVYFCPLNPTPQYKLTVQ